MWEIIAWPFGKILWLCYILANNYGWALFVFTAVIKITMLPSSAKQQISMVKMQRLNPKIEQLRKKYGNNKEKLNEATMELYNKENVNPMGSCAPMLATFIVLFAVIEVVYAPLTYIGNVPKAKLTAAQNTVYDVYTVSSAVKQEYIEELKASGVVFDGDLTLSDVVAAKETDLVDIIKEYRSNDIKSNLSNDRFTDARISEIAEMLESNPGLSEYITDEKKVSKRLVAAGASSRAQLLVISVSQEYPSIFDKDVVDLCKNFDYTFLGIYLGDYPSWNSILVLIPIISLISQLALTIISQYFQKKSGSTQKNSMGAMLYIMPLISFWIAFSFPAGIGIYWIFSSVLSLIQTVGLNLYFTPERTDKIVEKENKKARKKPSLYQMALESQKEQLAGQKSVGEQALEEIDEEMKLSRAEKKEAERKALNEARRRYAEKYGDDLDVPDENDDL